MASIIGPIWNSLKNVNPTAAVVTAGLVFTGAIAQACCWKGRKVKQADDEDEIVEVSQAPIAQAAVQAKKMMTQNGQEFRGEGFVCKPIRNGRIVQVQIDDGTALLEFSKYNIPQEIVGPRKVILTIPGALENTREQDDAKRAFQECFPNIRKLKVYLSAYAMENDLSDFPVKPGLYDVSVEQIQE